MKVLVLGADGQVGFELQRALAPIAEVTAWNRQRADLRQPQALVASLHGLDVDVIINAAAYTAVDRAETEPELAHCINAEAVAQLAEFARERRVLLVHYSTDYVLKGDHDGYADEATPHDPQGVYAASKAAGEVALAASGADYLCFRTSWVYAARGNNFLRTMLKLGATRDALNIVADQHGAPTGADLIADVTAHVLAQGFRERAAVASWCGVYHLVAGGETHWQDYALAIFAAAERYGLGLKIRPEGVQAITTAAYNAPAARPANSRLSTLRLRTRFGLELPDWREGVERCVRTIAEARV